MAEMREVFDAPILSGYGLTEAPILTMADLSDSDDELARSEGKPMPGVEIRFVTLDQRLVAMEARIQTSLLEVAPDLRRNRKSLGSRNRVIEPPEAVDEMVLPLKPHP